MGLEDDDPASFWGLCKRLFSGAFAGDVSFREGIPSLNLLNSPDPNHNTSRTFELLANWVYHSLEVGKNFERDLRIPSVADC